MSAADIEVRPIRPADVARVWEMVGSLAAYERLQHELVGSAEGLAGALFAEPPALEGLVAEEPGRVLGYALFYPTFSSFHTQPALWLEDLFVETAQRGRGVGKLLLAEVSRIALARGCGRLGWVVLDWNQPSIAFYEATGASRTPEGWYQYGLDRDAMRRLTEG